MSEHSNYQYKVVVGFCVLGGAMIAFLMCVFCVVVLTSFGVIERKHIHFGLCMDDDDEAKEICVGIFTDGIDVHDTGNLEVLEVHDE